MTDLRGRATWRAEPDEDGRLYPSYDVEIRRVADGLVRRYHMDHPWHSSSMFWWTEGNGGCDCNRMMDFQRAGGEDDTLPHPCGDTAYQVIRAIFPDGTTLQIDEP